MYTITFEEIINSKSPWYVTKRDARASWLTWMLCKRDC